MKEYIEREAAINAAILAHHIIDKNPCQNIKDCIGAIPAADVRPVVLGEWEKELCPNVRNYQYKCSICGEFSGYDSEGWIWKPNFCPNCGAKMEADHV